MKEKRWSTVSWVELDNQDLLPLAEAFLYKAWRTHNAQSPSSANALPTNGDQATPDL